MYYYEIAPTAIVRAGQSTFTYSAESKLSIGQLVQVPVGTRQMIGLVVQTTSRPVYTVKPVSALLELPPLPKPLVETINWIADYYMTPLATVLQTALPRGLTKNRRGIYKSPVVTSSKRTNIVFTADQQSALKSLAKMPSGTALLHGVTGSGKTAVYIELAKQVIASGRSVIVLVPEIALTSQLVASFADEFSDIILTHSQQSEAERHLAWQEALSSQTPRIVIGPRSALFTPLSDIGLIVIDEAHEPSFKQDQAPRYHAGRVAAALSRQSSAKLILGSATPSINDYYLAISQKRPIIEMLSPARQDTTAPSIQLVDMTKRHNFTRHRFLSDALLARIDATLADSQQTLIYHNRRGTTSTTLCEQCGWQAGCGRCYVPLTLHADAHQLLCHICGFHSKVPTMCPECKSADIIHKGIGTKLIESELRRLYPVASIVRFDGDSARGDALHERYSDIHDGTIDILIGTQVIAKGLDLPHLRTVGVVQADAGLSLPDFAASERSFQLLSQVIGRVGRSHHPTSVIVQSYQPNHPSIQDGIAQNYRDFYERTIAMRRQSKFPPFRYLLHLTCTYKTEATAVKNARKLAAVLKRELPDIELLGPSPAFYERNRDSYRWQLVLKSPVRQQLIDALDFLPPRGWQYDLDPVSLL